MWIVLALISAVTASTRDTISKRLLNAEAHLYVLGGSQFLIAGTLLWCVIFLLGAPVLESGFFSAVAVTVVLNVVATVFFFKSLKAGDMSLVLPLQSFTPAFLVLTSFVLLREMPTPLGLCGIALVVVGSYVLQWDSFAEPPLRIWKRLISHRASLYMIAVAAIYSVSSIYDKLASLRASPLFASATIDVALGLSLLALAPMSQEPEKGLQKFFARSWAWLLLWGVLFAAGTWAQNTALTQEIVPYVVAVTRLSAVFSVLYGLFVFKEKNIRWRLFGAAVMISGVALIAF